MPKTTNPTLEWRHRDDKIIATPDGYTVVPAKDVPAGKTLKIAGTQKDYRYTTGTSENLVIRGDALDALDGLAQLDPGLPAPQLIYIDPPYNTGTIFKDYDDGLNHAQWMGVMQTRFLALHSHLAETGSMWVHLDDSEMAYARVLLDEIFGRDNFVAQIVVEINPKGRQLDRYFAACHDYLLVYAKNKNKLKLEPGTTAAVNPADFPLQDNQGRYRLLPLRNTNKKFNPKTAPTMAYPLYANEGTGEVRTSPFDGAQKIMPVFGDLTPAVWRWSTATAAVRHNELIARTVRGRKGPRLDVYQIDRMHPGRRKKLKTIWPSREIGSSDSAKLALRKQFGDDVQFATPKPEPLIERIIASATEPGDYVMDVFAGSGTTGVVAARMRRHFVMAEREADTIEQHIHMRLERAGVSYQQLDVEPR